MLWRRSWRAIRPLSWEKNYEVYVEDRHKLGLKEFFAKENPHARQYLLARLLEVDRQGSHRFTPSQRAVLVREYVRSVLVSGVGCSANTCGNRVLQRYVAGQAQRLGDIANARAFQARLDRAFGSTPAKAVATKRSAPLKTLRRALQLFSVPAEVFAVAHPAVQIGSLAFLGFLAASSLLGIAQSFLIRISRQPLVTLAVEEEQQ